MTPDRLVIYHGPTCWDGFCSAWLIHRFGWGDNAEYFPATYDAPPPDVVGKDVLILDFSYRRPVLEAMAAVARSLKVLDYHKTAQAELEGLDYCTFDMALSGAQLTWRILSLPPVPPDPWLVAYTADRDLWRFALPDSKEVNAALRSYPLDFAVWDDLWEKESPKSLKRDGTAILRAEAVTVGDHVARAREITFDGYKILSVNATSLFSEIAGALAEGRPFGMAWFERDDGVRQYSLRSRDGGIDVSEIAKVHGGGGHERAAGFEEQP